MINVFWFRRDLRLHDNHGLSVALNAGLPVLPVFIYDKTILHKLEDKSDARLTFIHEHIHKMKEELERSGSSLKLIHATPEEAFEGITGCYDIHTVFTNEDYEPYATERDNLISKLLKKKGISFQTFKDQVVFAGNDVLKDDGKPYTVYTPYSKKWKKHFGESMVEPYGSKQKAENFLQVEPFKDIGLKEMGFQAKKMEWPSKKIPLKIISDYDKTRDFPAREGTSRMGVHLRFGTVSIRELMKVAIEHNQTYMNELIWREFFMMILWHFPHVVSESFRRQYDKIPWRNDEKEFQMWCEGKTGYPIVDAGMRQLSETGYMHNRVRMVTASFLTKHLLTDWRWGEAWFAAKLLDYELSSNNGGWQWAAGSGCDAAPYFRIFNPTSQQKKFDPELEYINQWVPQYGHEHYPEPIVEHSLARERALNTFQKALKS
jgi:deoxyribodipyrimidine photo-lyase